MTESSSVVARGGMMDYKENFRGGGSVHSIDCSDRFTDVNTWQNLSNHPV